MWVSFIDPAGWKLSAGAANGKAVSGFCIEFFPVSGTYEDGGHAAGVYGAAFFTAVRNRRNYREAFFILVMTVMVLLAAELLERRMTSWLYHDLNRELYEINTYEGQLDKIKYIFSKTGWTAFAAGFGGKILYLGISTYGLGWWGLLSLSRKARSAGLPAFFVAASVMAQLIISTVYNVIPDSYDSITFGRYQDYVMPVLIVAGIKELLTRIREKKRYFLPSALLLLLLSVVVSVYAGKSQLTQNKGYFMAGMNFLRWIRYVQLFIISEAV